MTLFSNQLYSVALLLASPVLFLVAFKVHRHGTILVAFVAILAVLTGCAELRGVAAGGLVGGGARALGASHDLALGLGVITAANVAADGARHERVVVVHGTHTMACPDLATKPWEDKAACQSAGGQPVDTGVMKPNGTPEWNCRLNCPDAGHQVGHAGQRPPVQVSLPTAGGPYDVYAILGLQNRLWCLTGTDGPIVSNPKRGAILYVCSQKTTDDFWKR